MYTCTVALVHSRVLGKASRPSERYCSLLPPGARARIRGKSRQNINRLPAVRVPTSDVNKCLVAQSPRSTSQAPSQGNTGPKLFQPWLAIDAGGYVMAESQPTAHTAHSNTHSFTAPTISLIEAICCNVTPRRPPGRLATSLTQPPYCLTVHGCLYYNGQTGQTDRRSQACIDLSGLFLLAGLPAQRSNVPSPDHQREARRARRVAAANAKLSRPLGFGTGASHHRHRFIIDGPASILLPLCHCTSSLASSIFARLQCHCHYHLPCQRQWAA